MSDATRPADADLVLTALRLGWTLAEVRGRNRPDAPHVALLSFPHAGHALPLRSERSAVEQAVEAESVLAYLATTLHVDGPSGTGTTPPAGPPPGPPGPGGVPFSQAVQETAQALHDEAAGTPGPAKRWDALADLLYHWDAYIQDALAAESETQSSAYQLGRGLAESYWALDATAPDGEPGSWKVLLGEQRRQLLTRHVGRIAAYFDPLTAPALAGSLQVWTAVVADRSWRDRPDAVDQLRTQTHRWYALVVLRQDPSALVHPGALLRHSGTTLRAARMFAPQLLLALLSFGAITAVSFLLATDSGSAALATVLGAVGFLGLSGAGIQATLKNRAHALLERLRTNAYADLVAEAITAAPTLPARPGLRGTSHPTADSIHRAATRRTLSVATGGL